MSARFVLLTEDSGGAPSGGHLFDARMLDAAARHDVVIESVVLRGPFARRVGRARALVAELAAGDRTLIVDSIAAAPLALALPVRRSFRAIGLVHQRPGGAGATPRTRSQAVLDRFVYRRLDLLIGTSGWLATLLSELAVPVVVVTPGRDHLALNAPPEDLRAGRRCAVLSVANWLPHKRVLDLIEAASRLEDDEVTLHLVGAMRPDTAYGRRVAARVTRGDVRERVVRHGAVPQARLAAFHAGADVFALPSIDEAYGMAVADALAAGLPVVGCRSGNVPRLVRDGRDGFLVEAGRIEALAWRLWLLARDEDRRREMAESARSHGEALPTWDETATAFFAALRGGTRIAPPRAA